MDTQQQRETHQVQAIQNVSGDELKNQACGSIGGCIGKRKKKMSSQPTQHSKYGFSKTVDVPYEEAVEKARAALKEEGFGVLCEIDIKEKLKEKLGIDFIGQWWAVRGPRPADKKQVRLG